MTSSATASRLGPAQVNVTHGPSRFPVAMLTSNVFNIFCLLGAGRFHESCLKNGVVPKSPFMTIGS
jgi:hypothetical protein